MKELSSVIHLKIIFCLVGSFVSLASCQLQKADTEAIVINDSTLLDVGHYVTKKIHVGATISNKPLSSQLIRVDGVEKYLLMDNGYIYQFDWNRGLLEDSIPTGQCGVLSNFSGFTYLNADSLLVYNSGVNHLFVINARGEVLKSMKVPVAQDDESLTVDVEGLNASRPLRQNGRILLSGPVLGNLQLANGMEVPVSESVDWQTGEWQTVAYYPETYTRHNWGSYYLNQLSIAQDSAGHVLYSFPVCPYVLRYDLDFALCDTLWMRSRYDKGIEACELTPEDFDEDPSKEIRYYIGQTSYLNILYDAYHRLYLRVVEHPLKDWPGKGAFCKPVSIIVSDESGRILSESSIVSLAKEVYLDNMHICSDGIAIALGNPDENNIYFACISIGKQ